MIERIATALGKDSTSYRGSEVSSPEELVSGLVPL
jgi:hypothetical protein